MTWAALKKEVGTRAGDWRHRGGPNIVPDEWTQAVLALDSVSEEALAYLVRSKEQRGWLSLQHALFFVGLEDKARQASADAAAEASATIATAARATAETRPDFAETV